MTAREQHARAGEYLARAEGHLYSRAEDAAGRELEAAVAHAVMALAGQALDPPAGRDAAVAGLVSEARESLGRADGKAATLLALASGALAGLVAFSRAAQMAGAAAALAWAATGLAGASVSVLLTAVRPRLLAGDREGFDAHRAILAASDQDGRLAAAEAHLQLLAGLVMAKYRRIRLATGVMQAALALVVAAAAVLALGGAR